MEITTKHIKKLYYSIGEVSKITGLKQYVLRYWETEFNQLGPNKNKSGNRIYRQKDIELIKKIKDLLYNRKFTIDGARHQLAKNKININPTESVIEKDENIQPQIETGVDKILLIKIREELKALLDHLSKN